MFAFVVKCVDFYLQKEEKIFWEQNNWVRLEGKSLIQAMFEDVESDNEWPDGKTIVNIVFQGTENQAIFS